MGAAFLWSSEADDYKITCANCFHLEPAVRPSFRVLRARLLCDDTFESHLHYAVHERLAFTLDVIQGLQRSKLRHHIHHELFSFNQRQRSQVEIPERKQVEHVEHRGQLNGCMTDVQRRRQSTPTLQHREAGQSPGIIHDDFAVENAFINGQRLHCARNLRKHRRVIVAVTCEKQSFTLSLCRNQPIAIELELEDPSVT